MNSKKDALYVSAITRMNFLLGQISWVAGCIVSSVCYESTMTSIRIGSFRAKSNKLKIRNLINCSDECAGSDMRAVARILRVFGLELMAVFYNKMVVVGRHWRHCDVRQ